MPRGSKNLACSRRECRVDLSDSASLVQSCRHKMWGGPARPVKSSCCRRYRAHSYGIVGRAPQCSGFVALAGIVLFLTIPAFESAAASDRGILAAPLGQLTLDEKTARSPTHAGSSAVAGQRSDRLSRQSYLTSFVPGAMPARVLIRYLSNDPKAARRAHDLANALIAEGIEVSDVRGSVAALRTELRYFYVPDEAVAQAVGHLAAVEPVRLAFAADDVMPRPGTIQLTVSGP
jgi:hypothetical protein